MWYASVMDRKVVLNGKAFWASEVVRKVVVRPVKREEEVRWKGLIRQHHHLGLDYLVGGTILHVAESGV